MSTQYDFDNFDIYGKSNDSGQADGKNEQNDDALTYADNRYDGDPGYAENSRVDNDLRYFNNNRGNESYRYVYNRKGYNRDYVDTIRSKATPVNTCLIIINVLVFAWMTLTGDVQDTEYMYNHGASYWPSVIYDHEYYRLLTCAFIHFGLSHLGNNMIVLAFIGDNLERALGTVKYIIFYLAAALGSSAVSIAWSYYNDENIISGGASGAIFGVVGGIAIILIRNHGQLEDLSIRQIILFAVLSVYYGISSVDVDNAAHIGGFIIGALLALILYRKKGKSQKHRY